jgi:hypothetical protein
MARRLASLAAVAALLCATVVQAAEWGTIIPGETAQEAVRRV